MALTPRPDAAYPPLAGIGTYMVPVLVGLGYFVFLGWLVSHHAPGGARPMLMTLLHGGLFAAAMTWLWWPGDEQRAPRPRQITLRGILGATAVAGICVSYVAQVIRSAPASQSDSALQSLPGILLFAGLYFICSLPYASILGVGATRIGQVLLRNRRRKCAGD